MTTIAEKYYYWVRVISRIHDTNPARIQSGTSTKYIIVRNTLLALAVLDEDIPNRYAQERHNEFVPEYLRSSEYYGTDWKLIKWIFNLYNK